MLYTLYRGGTALAQRYPRDYMLHAPCCILYITAAQRYPRDFLHFVAGVTLQPEPEILAADEREGCADVVSSIRCTA